MMLLSLLALAVGITAASDEPEREVETGSRLSKRVEKDQLAQQQVREIQAQYGNCVVKKQYKAAQSFVLSPNLEGREFERAVAKVGDPYCVLAATARYGSQMTFPADVMRYTLADALIRREFANGPQYSLKDAAPIEQPTLDEAKYRPELGSTLKQAELAELARNRTLRVTQVYLAQFGECVVRADTANSFALLSASPDSAQEGAAFASLGPVFAQCVSAGQSLSFSKATLRGTIAMNFYRLAHASRTSGQAVGAKK